MPKPKLRKASVEIWIDGASEDGGSTRTLREKVNLPLDPDSRDGFIAGVLESVKQKLLKLDEIEAKKAAKSAE